MAQSQSIKPLTPEELADYQRLLELQMADGLDNIHPYDWQTRFIAATRTHRECMLMASNRTGKCATAASRITLANGVTKTFKQLYDQGQSFVVKSWDGQRVVNALASVPIKKPIEPCVRLWFTDGSWFECALNHRVLLQDGRYAFVSELLVNDEALLGQSLQGAYVSPGMAGNHIVAYESIDSQEVYDFFVPAHGNYIANGIVHHNTYLGTWIDAIHATGRYPADWPGHRFTSPPTQWLLGYSGPKCRDLLQAPMFGNYSNGKFAGSALVSSEQIVDSMPSGVSGLADSVTIKWHDAEGRAGKSTIQFKSYSQGQHALMGDKVDHFHIDEEPKDHKIYPQVITRTADGDNGQGGRGIFTFTPENGRTELVVKFMDDPGKHQYLQIATFDDAYHLTEETKEALLDSWPDYQRSMRSRGVPLMGVGLIYEHDVESLKVDGFDIPDYWYVINGMDIGWDHPQAHVQLVWDKDHDMFYVTRAWKARRKQPYEAWHAIKSWAEYVPTAWPHDGLQTEKGSGKPMKTLYAKEGWNMLPEHATWETGGYHVEPGLMEINSLMGEGRFKIGRTLTDLAQEIERYHRIDTGNGNTRIVKTDDDLLDAVRAAYMMRRYAVRICDLKPRENTHLPRKVVGRDARRGY